MDVIEIDGASNRGIDEIRELRENVRYTPAKSRSKIYIIDEVHMLTREAFNALLKTLEEPPPHIIFVFATTEPHKIPATILSRCQRYDFKRIPLKEIIGNLKRIVEEEKIRLSQRGLLSIAQASEGSLRDAQSLLDQVISYGGKDIREEDIAEILGLVDRKILYDAIEAIANRDIERCVEIVDHVYHFGYDLQHFCRELLQYLRNLILIKVSQHPEGLMELPEEELAVLRKQAERFQFDQLSHLFSLLLKGEGEVAQSTFPRTMLEMVLIRMAALRPVLSIDEILKKLEKLEKGEHPTMAMGEEDDPPTNERWEGLNEAVSPMGVTEEMGPLSLEKPTDPTGSPKEGEDGEEFQKVREETWKKLVDFTRARNPVLGSFLAMGNLIDVSDEKIEIGFEKDSFHYDRISEKENRSQLEAICHEYLQRKAKVIISALDQKMGLKRRMISEAERPSRNKSESRPEKETEENPLIQEALRLFNGRIVEG
jgi:DNA polymerase-3 subunit gamma/tau